MGASVFLKFLTVMIRIPKEGTRTCGLEDCQEIKVSGLGSFLTDMKVIIVPKIWADSKNYGKNLLTPKPTKVSSNVKAFPLYFGLFPYLDS